MKANEQMFVSQASFLYVWWGWERRKAGTFGPGPINYYFFFFAAFLTFFTAFLTAFLTFFLAAIFSPPCFDTSRYPAHRLHQGPPSKRTAGAPLNPGQPHHP